MGKNRNQIERATNVSCLITENKFLTDILQFFLSIVLFPFQLSVCYALK